MHHLRDETNASSNIVTTKPPDDRAPKPALLDRLHTA